uniref:(northern house mosquito) hypothetical protein n=1 Tax=Culex pipiens TaxID=7175 RepID=A0A8D8I803_CULPI
MGALNVFRTSSSDTVSSLGVTITGAAFGNRRLFTSRLIGFDGGGLRGEVGAATKSLGNGGHAGMGLLGSSAIPNGRFGPSFFVVGCCYRGLVKDLLCVVSSTESAALCCTQT